MSDHGVRLPAPVAALNSLNATLLFVCRWIVIGLVGVIAVMTVPNPTQAERTPGTAGVSSEVLPH